MLPGKDGVEIFKEIRRTYSKLPVILVSNEVSWPYVVGELGDSMTPDQKRVTIQQIIESVTKYYNVKVSDLQSKKRHKSIAFPEQI